MELVHEEKWVYQLHIDQKDFKLSVVIGGIGIYCMEFTLTDSELLNYEKDEINFIRKLAEDVSNNPYKYLLRVKE